jgi:fructose-bisphosphate aldolase class I
VAEATIRCLRRAVPAAVPGIVFLSGGQDELQATAHLNAMNAADGIQPWALSFSYARALQASAMRTWQGQASNVPAAQDALARRARCNSAAREGRYTPAMEHGGRELWGASRP